MKLARKQMITALLSMAAAGALAAPAMAQQGTFGGMPTVTPQSQLEAQKKQAAKKKSSSRKRKLPAYVVVDKGGPNAGLYDEADDSYDNDVSRARYTSINEAIKNVAWGGVVVVMPGVYEENIELERSVSLEGRRAGASGPRIRQVAAQRRDREGRLGQRRGGEIGQSQFRDRARQARAPGGQRPRQTAADEPARAGDQHAGHRPRPSHSRIPNPSAGGASRAALQKTFTRECFSVNPRRRAHAAAVRPFSRPARRDPPASRRRAGDTSRSTIADRRAGLSPSPTRCPP